MLKLTEMQTRVLEALARYTYLTASQLHQIGISKSLPVIWRLLRQLTAGKRALVGVIDFPPQLRVEKVERVHFLSRRGATVLAEIHRVDAAEVRFPQAASAYHRDYWHRRYCIDFHIWLTRALEANSWDIVIAAWDRYFDKVGANRTKDSSRGRLRAKTRLDLGTAGSVGSYIIPDVNFVLQSQREPSKQALFCLEMCNGKNTKRVLRQIEKHTVAMQEGAMADRYGVSQNYRALFLFAEWGLMDAVFSRLREIGKESFEHLLYFGHLEQAAEDPLGCWQQPAIAGGCNFVTGKPIP